ncbi:hypothetical protein ACLMJK_007533 [Lecanora helva]
MLSTHAVVFSALTCLISAQTTADSDPFAALPTNSLSDTQLNFISSVEVAPQFTAAAAALATAVPTSKMSDLEADPTGFFESVLQADPTPDWVSAVPSSVLAYYSGINQGIVSIATNEGAASGSAVVTGTAASPVNKAEAGSSTASSTGSAMAKSTNAAVRDSSVIGTGLMGALGVAVAGAML